MKANCLATKRQLERLNDLVLQAPTLKNKATIVPTKKIMTPKIAIARRHDWRRTFLPTAAARRHRRRRRRAPNSMCSSAPARVFACSSSLRFAAAARISRVQSKVFRRTRAAESRAPMKNDNSPSPPIVLTRGFVAAAAAAAAAVCRRARTHARSRARAHSRLCGRRAPAIRALMEAIGAPRHFLQRARCANFGRLRRRRRLPSAQNLIYRTSNLVRAPPAGRRRDQQLQQAATLEHTRESFSF